MLSQQTCWLLLVPAHLCHAGSPPQPDRPLQPSCRSSPPRGWCTRAPKSARAPRRQWVCGDHRVVFPEQSKCSWRFRSSAALENKRSASRCCSPKQPSLLSSKAGRTGILLCSVKKYIHLLEPGWLQTTGLEMFISLITCSPLSWTTSPPLNFPEVPGILTLACLWCLENRQVMKLRTRWVYGKTVTPPRSSLEPLFSGALHGFPMRAVQQLLSTQWGFTPVVQLWRSNAKLGAQSKHSSDQPLKP